jgi:hypothetical protein
LALRPVPTLWGHRRQRKGQRNAFDAGCTRRLPRFVWLRKRVGGLTILENPRVEKWIRAQEEIAIRRAECMSGAWVAGRACPSIERLWAMRARLITIVVSQTPRWLARVQAVFAATDAFALRNVVPGSFHRAAKEISLPSVVCGSETTLPTLPLLVSDQ